ncbi:MAG: rhamnulose-1-phosphate aldolase [Bacteroidales bacterium]
MKHILKKNKAFKSIVHEIAEVAAYLWQRGWAERNAGNISVNINEIGCSEISDHSQFPFFELPATYPNLANCCFLVTGTGKRLRDFARKPMNGMLVIKLNELADGYWILSQQAGPDNFLPTSELPTHLGIHQMIAQRGSAENVVMHTHATELIALTQAKEFCNEQNINKLLWGMHPETIIFIPKGVGFVPYSLPGSMEIATETLKSLQNHDVALWEKHGVFAIGNSVGETFDVIDILAKSARIFFMCRSANIAPEGMTDTQLAELKLLAANF